MPPRRLQDVLQKRLQDVYKTSCQEVFNTSLKRLQNVSQRFLQDVFQTYHQVKLFLLTRLQDVFTFLRRTANTILPRRRFSEKFMVNVQNLQE